MPRLSDSMEEGTILRWLKGVGDEVKRGDELVEIETDKANMTYEATDEGVLLEIVAGEGDTLPIGEVIARIGATAEAEQQPTAAKAAAGSREGATKAGNAQPQRTERSTSPIVEPRGPVQVDGDGRVKASPIARRMARDLDVELSRIEGSGPGGRIVKADVEAAAGEAAPAPPREAQRPAPTPAAAAPTPETAKGEVEVIELNRLQQT